MLILLVMTDNPVTILGISGLYHDSAACLVTSEGIVACAQEERFTRIKHDPAFPVNAIDFVLKKAGIKRPDYVVFYEKPIQKLERLLDTYLDNAPMGVRFFAVSAREYLSSKLWVKEKIVKAMGRDVKVLFSSHHLSHAASAFFPSPFKDAAVLTLDGVGEWTTNAMYNGSGNILTPLKTMRFPNSIGLLYSAFTSYLGFRVNNDEYKVMGLAPYGSPCFVQTILDNVIDLHKDGSYALNMNYFSFNRGLRMTNSKFHRLFDGPPRPLGAKPGFREADIARSIQKVVEMVVLRQAKEIHGLTRHQNLVMAGGVALNCVANGVVQRAGIFDKIWVQPAATDAGSALGAAMAVLYIYLGHPRTSPKDIMQGGFLGREYDAAQIESVLGRFNWKFISLDDVSGADALAKKLADGQVVAMFRGREEFGPRALGNRSILADPTDPGMKERINRKVKFREPFRPFAPAVTKEAESEYFQPPVDNPYMVITTNAARSIRRPAPDRDAMSMDELSAFPMSAIPAVTHCDYSARVQTVRQDISPFFHRVLNAFKDKKGLPVLLNTSFNLRGEPVVSTPEDAMRTFVRSDIDAMLLGPSLVTRSDIGETPPASDAHDESVTRLKGLAPAGLIAGLAILAQGMNLSFQLIAGIIILSTILLFFGWFRPDNRASRVVNSAQKAIFNGLGTGLLIVVYFGILSWLGPLSRLGKKPVSNGYQDPDEKLDSSFFEREF